MLGCSHTSVQTLLQDQLSMTLIFAFNDGLVNYFLAISICDTIVTDCRGSRCWSWFANANFNPVYTFRMSCLANSTDYLAIALDFPAPTLFTSLWILEQFVVGLPCSRRQLEYSLILPSLPVASLTFIHRHWVSLDIGQLRIFAEY